MPVLAVVFVVALAASCGGDDDAADNVTTPGSATTVGATSVAGNDGSPFGGLILEESYLRGTWCSEGANYVVDDNGVKIGPLDPMPIEAVFGNPNLSLVSSSDDEFVVLQSVREVTFIRGSC